MQHIPDPLVVEMVDRLLGTVCDGACIDAVESGQRARALWETIARGAIHRAWIPESLGGGGAGVAEVCAIARALGRHAAPVPLSDTVLAGHVLAAHGIELGDGPCALALAGTRHDQVAARGTRVDGLRRRVPFASQADWIVVDGHAADGGWLAVFDPGRVQIDSGRALSGEPLDSVRMEAAEPSHRVRLAPPWDRGALRLAGALLRAEQMAGALARVLQMSVGYAREREAFGRPIARFQAVQHNLAMLAGETAAAAAAANAAMMAVARHGIGSSLARYAVAAAKVRVGEAAGAGAAIAHQVHGAMGFTQEHRLHQFTRRLWSWRDEHGAETEWAMELGRMVAAEGADRLWPGLTAV